MKTLFPFCKMVFCQLMTSFAAQKEIAILPIDDTLCSTEDFQLYVVPCINNESWSSWYWCSHQDGVFSAYVFKAIPNFLFYQVSASV